MRWPGTWKLFRKRIQQSFVSSRLLDFFMRRIQNDVLLSIFTKRPNPKWKWCEIFDFCRCFVGLGNRIHEKEYGEIVNLFNWKLSWLLMITRIRHIWIIGFFFFFNLSLDFWTCRPGTHNLDPDHLPAGLAATEIRLGNRCRQWSGRRRRWEDCGFCWS